MTLKLRRQIVKAFMGGESLTVLIRRLQEANPYVYMFNAVECTLRDYLNGRFTLEPKKREKFVGVSIPMPKDETFKGIVLDKPEAWIPKKPLPPPKRKRDGR